MIGSLSAFFNRIPDGNDDVPLPDYKEFRRDHRHCSSLAQFERRLVQERTTAGLSAARTRGCLGGRPAVAAADPRMAAAKRLHQEHSLSIDEVCKTRGISRRTFYRYLALPDGIRGEGHSRHHTTRVPSATSMVRFCQLG